MFLIYNLHLTHCLPKVGLHALDMIIAVLLSTLYSAQGKKLGTNSPYEEKTIFFKKIPDPLLNIKWYLLNHFDCIHLTTIFLLSGSKNVEYCVHRFP